MESQHELEQALIGALFLNADMLDLVAGKVTPDCFSPSWSQVFRAMLRVVDQGIVPDPIAIAESLSKENLASIGGRSGLSDTMNLAVSGEAATGYAEQLRANHDRMTAQGHILTAAETIGMGGNAVDIGQGLVASLEKIGEGDDTFAARTLKDIVREYSNSEGTQATISTGYNQLDLLHGGGLEPDSFTILAAAPSVGKSQLAFNLMRQFKLADGTPANSLFISQEMGAQLVFDRLVAMSCRLDSLLVRKFRTGQVDIGSDEYNRYGKQYVSGCGVAYDLPVTVYDKQTLNSQEIRSLVARYHKQVDIIVLDYIQLCRSMQGQDKKTMASEVSHTLKDLAKRYRKPVIGICSLSRAGYSDVDNPPQLHHMKESGDLEFDADNVWMLWREKKFGAEKEQLDLYVRKQRQGPCDRLRFMYTLATGIIEEYKEEKEGWNGV